MNLIIHRGTHNIGGTCIELINKGTRLIFDIGLPLNIEIVESDDIKQAEQQCKPNVKGLYKDSPDTNLVSAVFLSHLHPDHSKFIVDVHPKIPVYLSEGTFAVMKSLELFTSNKMLSENIQIINTKDKKKYKIGDFEIYPFPVDHSAPDALGFIITCNGKTIVYTGDFRDHGRKGVLLEYFKKEIPKQPDLLLIEGTMVGSNRVDKLLKTETLLEDEICNILTNTQEWPVLVNFSPTNLDRLISILRACMKTKTIFVIDLFTAYIYLEVRKLGWNIPDLRPDLFNVLCFSGHEKPLKENNQTEFLTKVFKNNIKFAELTENKKRLVLFRPGHIYSYVSKKVHFNNKTLIYSQYDGVYPGQEDKIAKYNEYINNHNIKSHHIHTSGHAYIETLKSFIDHVQPKRLIPIHTLNPEKFQEIFSDHFIELPEDGQSIEI